MTTALCGDGGDPVQTLWSWAWLRDALVEHRDPFFTDRVFYPGGLTLVFQTFDLPSGILTLPLFWCLPPIAVYNTAVLLAFALSAYGMERLVRELTSDRLVALASGVVFTATPYHLAHLRGHMQLLSMGWLPLYLLYLHRMLSGRARLRDAVKGGVFLGLASLASWYHLLDAVVLTPVLFGLAFFRARAPFVVPPSRRFLTQALALAVAYLGVAGPLLLAILRARAREPVAGAHDPVEFSGNLEAFLHPSLAQLWSHTLDWHALFWSGNAAESALYVGFALVACVVVGVAIGGRLARAYALIALVGAVLA
jgi:hypothetical protein